MVPTTSRLRLILLALAGTRGQKINAQRTQIAELKDQVSELESRLPPTPTPAPNFSGKDAYPYVAEPLKSSTRPFNHFGEKLSYCGTVTYIAVARPGKGFVLGDTHNTIWTTVVQLRLG